MSDPEQLLSDLREACLKRGVSGIKSFARTFRIYDDDRSHSLNFDEFKKGLSDYGVTMTDPEARSLFNLFDCDENGTLNFDEFLCKLRQPMTQSRIDIVEKAFTKLDATGDGKITAADLKGIYNARGHPKFLNGELTEEEVFNLFLKQFEMGDPDGVITSGEFLNYYSGVSASIDDDAYFDLMMRNAWKL